MVTNAISANVFGILMRVLKLCKSLHYIQNPPLPVTRVLLKLEDPDVIGNDVLLIIKLQENFSNKNQLGKTEPIYLTFSPSFMPEEKMSAAQNNGLAFSIRVADDACSHVTKFNELSWLLKFFP